jgi:anti-sigma-K factor RskA/putative zinc finger protein
MTDLAGPGNDHPLDDLAAHALDALDPAERRAVDDHLSGCAACRTELARHHETLAVLAPGEAPPPSVWEGIASAIGASDLSDPHTPTTGTAVLDQPGVGGSTGPTLRVVPDDDPTSTPGADPDGPTHAGPTDPAGPTNAVPPADPAPGPGANPPRAGGHDATTSSLGDAPSHHRPTSLRWLAAAACLLVAAGLGGVFGFALADSGDGGTGIGALAEQASQDPDSVLATLADSTGQAVARVAADEDGAYMLLDGLENLPEGQAYQLWSLDGPEPVSLGMLGRDGTNTVAFRLPPTITELAISVAPTSGDATPAGDFRASGAITRS